MNPTTMMVRRTTAFFYACGRVDARRADEPYVDPSAFTEHYIRLWQAYDTGRSSHMASVQDCWATYRDSHGITEAM